MSRSDPAARAAAPRNRLNPRARGFIVLLGLLSSLTMLSVDPFVPVLPLLVKEFSVPVATVQSTFTAFFVGQALGQALYGPVSDRFGRRRPLIVGLSIFLAATVYCANARSIEGLIAGRFFQALGACSGAVLVRSIVRDLYAWGDAAQKLFVISVFFSVVPIVGPLAATVLLGIWPWSSVFWMMALLAAPLLAVVALGLPETAPPRAAATPGTALFRDHAFLLRQRHFTLYLLVILFSQAGIFGFVSHSSFVMVGALGFSVAQFGMAFALMMSGHIVGALIGTRMVRRRGIDATLRLGVGIGVVSGLVLGAFAWVGAGGALAVIVPVFCFMFGMALVIPNAIAAAMSPFPEIAGSAASLIGIAQLAGGASISYILGASYDGTTRPLAAAVALSVLVAFAVHEGWIRRASPQVSRS